LEKPRLIRPIDSLPAAIVEVEADHGFGSNNEVLFLGLFNADAHLDAFIGDSPQSGPSDNANRVWLSQLAGDLIFADGF